ncbi:MAG: glycosyl transferase family 1 [Patescibacteria group bacterium]|nr:MAG: glycosyl transferase family 1 [Patescibacteria group bacterium]
MRKKILFLSQVYPYPADGGGKIKTLNSLKTLAKDFDVYAIFISEKKPLKKDIEYLKKIGVKKIKVFYNLKILASVKDDYPHLIMNFLKLRPHYVFQYTFAPAFSYIKNAVSSYKPDIIHIDHINIAQYLPKEKNEVWILEHHNLEFYLLWTRFLYSSKWSRKLYLLIESVLTYLFESKKIKQFDFVFTISQEEAERSKRFFGIRNVSAQPLVYPTITIKKKLSLNPHLLFIGGLGWPPNEDAIEWFINQMFPIILEKIPNVELHVVGKDNPILTHRLPKHTNIFLHGYQKDITPFLQKADIFILPFRMGGGVRIKSLTALSAGVPIVSTKLGVEGLKVKNNTHYLEANTEIDFANSVITLLKSKKMQDKMSKNQTEYLTENHSKKLNRKWLDEYHFWSTYPHKKNRS